MSDPLPSDMALDAENICLGCSESVTDGSVVQFGPAFFHIACFCCAKCTAPVAETSGSLLRLASGHPLCQNCAEVCKNCGKSIGDEAVVTGPDEAFHADCFRCVKCSSRIEDLVYARTKDGIHCMPCHHERQERRKTRKQHLMQQEDPSMRKGDGFLAPDMAKSSKPSTSMSRLSMDSSILAPNGNLSFSMSSNFPSPPTTSPTPLSNLNLANAISNTLPSTTVMLVEQLELERDQLQSRLDRSEKDFTRLKTINIKLATELAIVTANLEEEKAAREQDKSQCEKLQVEVAKHKDEYNKLLETYELMANAQSKLSALPPEKEFQLQETVIKMQAQVAELKAELKEASSRAEEEKQKREDLEKSVIQRDIKIRAMENELSSLKYRFRNFTCIMMMTRRQSPITAYASKILEGSNSPTEIVPTRTLADELRNDTSSPTDSLTTDVIPLPTITSLRKQHPNNAGDRDSFYSSTSSPRQSVAFPATIQVVPMEPTEPKPDLPRLVKPSRSATGDSSMSDHDILARVERRSSQHVKTFQWDEETSMVSPPSSTTETVTSPPTSEKSSSSIKHNLVRSTYMRPAKCFVCNEKVWGQEVRCQSNSFYLDVVKCNQISLWNSNSREVCK